MVLEKIKTDGLQPTIEAVFNKLDQPLPLGYCNVGQVADIGAGVSGFEVGDRVISNGKHAEAVSVPLNLCAKVPDNVSDEEAAFTVLGDMGPGEGRVPAMNGAAHFKKMLDRRTSKS